VHAKRMKQVKTKMPLGYRYAPRKGSISAGMPLTKDDLVATLSAASDITIAADEIAGRGLPREVIDGLPPELRSGLQQWHAELHRWVSVGVERRERLVPLLRQLHKLVRAEHLTGAKFQIGDPVETPLGRGIVRDLLRDEDYDDRTYVVDGRIWPEDQLQPVAAVDQLADLHGTPE